MLITFSTRSGPSVSMFENIATTLIKRMGHSDTIPGAILAADLQGYYNTLQQALKQEQAVAEDADDQDFIDEPVSLQQRSYPLMELMKKAIERGENLMWDYD